MWKVGNVVTDVPLGSDFIGYGFNVMTSRASSSWCLLTRHRTLPRTLHGTLKRLLS